MTLSVLQPLKGGNRAALLQLVNGDFISGDDVINPYLSLRDQTLIDAGYTLIRVTPGGTPKHSIPEILSDCQRAVRFVRYHAKRFAIDPERLAITGTSSGGYLSLMVGVADTAPPFPSEADPTWPAKQGDPVEAVSSRVQAVIGYCGPTDWLNYGKPGKAVLDHELPVFQSHLGIFDLYEFDATRFGFNRITDRTRQLQELKKLSPIERATRTAAPTLIFHGDKDVSVPIEQSERMVAALRAVGASADLVTKPGEGHGWTDTADDVAKVVAWLDRHLRIKPAPGK